MNVAFQRNVGSFIRAVPAMDAAVITAGAGNDGLPVDGLTIDRNDYVSVVLSALAVMHVEVNVAADETLSVNIAVQDSADGVTWATYEPGPPDTYEAEVFAEDGHFCATRKIQLGGARRYVRIRPTLTLSAGATDTVGYDGVLIIAGSDELPLADAEAAGS